MRRSTRALKGTSRPCRRRRVALLAALGMLASMWTVAPGVSVAAATFTVNDTGDGQDLNPGDGVCDVVGPANCTLRAAIMEANATADTDTIEFDITPDVISPLDTLPSVTEPVVIDGTTDPTSDRVELDGSLAGVDEVGLLLIEGSTARGLIINDFDRAGIEMLPGGGANTVVDCRIGTNPDGTTGEGNGTGIIIQSPDNIIGTPAEGNLISRNSLAGVSIGGATATGNKLEGNLIGTDATGTADLGNSEHGVHIVDAPGNHIGGPGAGAGNVISGQGRDGVRIEGLTATGNRVEGNRIGTNGAGTAALSNDVGVRIIDAPGNVVGSPGAGNVISGSFFTLADVFLVGDNATGNVVQGNLVGTNAAGTAVLPSARIGILLIGGTSGNTIGGDGPGEGNVTAGHNLAGIDLANADDNEVQGNKIGTDITGTVDLGNQQSGMLLFDTATGNVIGGTTDGAANLIAGNDGPGIWFAETGSDNRIEGNRIGTDATGANPLPNTGPGIRFETGSSGNTVGGTAPGAGNRIAYNGGAGVEVLDGVENAILGNSIEANGGLGIDLGGDGPTPNDPGDVDGGPNDLQNFPVLTEVTLTSVSGTLNSLPNKQFRIEVFSSSAPDPSGFGEGAQFLGATDVTTDGAGNAAFTVAAAVPPNSFVSATATDETSEFSAVLQAPGPPGGGGGGGGGDDDDDDDDDDDGDGDSGRRRGRITIVEDIRHERGVTFGFHTKNLRTKTFRLGDDRRREFKDLKPGTYTIAQDKKSGWTLKRIVCKDPSGGTKVVLKTRRAVIKLKAGEHVICTFANE